MAQLTIVIDGDTLIDKDINGQTQTVSELEPYLRPGDTSQLSTQFVVMAGLRTAASGKPFRAEIVTRPGGWTLKVDTPR